MPLSRNFTDGNCITSRRNNCGNCCSYWSVRASKRKHRIHRNNFFVSNCCKDTCSIEFKTQGGITMNATVTGTSQALKPTEWQIDPAHSAAHFSVRHLTISNVRGEFRKVSGKVLT